MLTTVERLSIAEVAANSCEPLIASVEPLLTRPAATLVMVRSLPTEPTLTVEVGVVPAKL